MSPIAAIEPLESRIAPAAMLALTDQNSLLRFDTATPNHIQASLPIAGLGAGESLVAIDFEPDSGLLYGLAIDSASQGHIYRLNAGTGAATFIVTLQPKPFDDAPYSALVGSHFSLDFAVSSLSTGEVRIVSDTGQNLRLTNLGSGLVETQPALQYLSTDPNAGTPLSLSGAMYNNTRPDGFYGIDVASDRLVFSFPKTRIDSGIYTTIRQLGVDASGPVGMDLERSDHVLFASLQVNGSTSLYTINVSGPAALTHINTIGDGATVIRDIELTETVWVGLGENNLWSNPANWSSGIAPAEDGVIVLKSGSEMLATVNDFAPYIHFKSISLHGQNSITGSPATISDGVYVTGSAHVQIGLRIAKGPPDGGYPMLGAAADSHLTLDAPIDNKSNRLLLVGSGQITIAGQVSGFGYFEVSGADVSIDGDSFAPQQIDVFSGSLALTGDHSDRSVFANGVGRYHGGSPVGSVYSPSGGIIAPGGDQIDSFVTNSLNLSASTKLEFQLGWAANSPVNDSIQVGGNAHVNIRGELILSDSPESEAGSRFMLVRNDGDDPITEGFAGLPEGHIVTGTHHRYWITYQGGDGNDVVLVQLLAPNIAPDGRSATFTDSDGDLVRVTISQGSLSSENFVLLPPSQSPAAEFLSLTLNALPDGTKLTIKATPQDRTGARRPDGDGYVNVGAIHAAGVILGDVLVDGNLGQITAGKAAGSLAVKSLSVQALGGLDAFDPDLSANYASDIAGHLGKLTVATDVAGAFLAIQGDVTSVVIGGSIIGGPLENSGRISATGSIAFFTVRGSIFGGTGENSGSLEVGGAVKLLRIGGSVQGGSAANSGAFSIGTLSTLAIGGDIVGGAGHHSGAIVSSQLGNVSIKGALQGGAGEKSGSFDIQGKVGRVSIGQGMRGGDGAHSGSLLAESDILSLKVGGTLSGNVISLAGRLSELSVAGSLLGSAGARLQISALSIGKVGIKGEARSVDFASESTLAGISIRADARDIGVFATGNAAPAKTKDAIAIGVVNVGGSLAGSSILAGYSFAAAQFSNPDVAIGSVRIGGDFIQSNVAAGIASVDPLFGNPDDRVIGDGGNEKLHSYIASVLIKGQAYGSREADQSFGIVAESLRKIRLGRVALPLTSGLDEYIVGHGGNFHIREVATALIE